MLAFSFISFLLTPFQLSEGIRVWDASAGERHTLLLADGDCIQPIIYYSGQQVKEAGGEEKVEEMEEEEEDERPGGYTQQPVLLPFCMNVRLVANSFDATFVLHKKPWHYV